MARKFDLEDVLDLVLEIMTSGDALNAQIAAVEAEKTAAGKGLEPALEPIAAYHVQSWSDDMLKKSPVIFYGVEDITAVSNGGAVAKTYRVFVEAVLVDSGQRNDGYKRINRYARALEELFGDKFTPAVAMSTIKIEQIRPMAWKLNEDSDDELKVGGISIQLTIV